MDIRGIRQFIDTFTPVEHHDQIWIHPDTMDAIMEQDSSGKLFASLTRSSRDRKFVYYWNEAVPKDMFMAVVGGKVYWNKLEYYEGADF